MHTQATAPYATDVGIENARLLNPADIAPFEFQPGDEYQHADGSWQAVPEVFLGKTIPQGVRVRREFLF